MCAREDGKTMGKQMVPSRLYHRQSVKRAFGDCKDLRIILPAACNTGASPSMTADALRNINEDALATCPLTLMVGCGKRPN